MHKLRVGVIMGGKSIEKEVSFNSGRTVCDHLDVARYDIIPLFQTYKGDLFILPWHFLHRGKISDFEHRLHDEATNILWDDLKTLIDFMFIAVHGQFAEDGTLQGFLEILGIPYLGAKVFASALRMNKQMNKRILQTHGIDVPRDIAVQPFQIHDLDNHLDTIYTQLEQKNIQLPYIVKPACEGSSLGISAVFQLDELKVALQKAFAESTKPQPILIEEKLTGMEFTCISLIDYNNDTIFSLPPTEVIPEADSHFFSYDQKYMPGRALKYTPARCSPELIKQIQETCVKTMQILAFCTMSRIDGFVTDDERVVIVDPNSLSGMGPASFIFREAAEYEMNHTHLINHLIETELQAYGMLEPLLQQEQKEDTMMHTTKLRVAVLLGGRSNEKEISLESGRNITYKLSPKKYETIPIFVSSNLELYPIGPKLLIRNSTKEIEELLDPATKIKWADLPAITDFVFIGLHGGEGENGCVQGALEMLGLPYNGPSVLTSALCMDKYKTCTYLRTCGFEVPRSFLIHKADYATNQEQTIKQIVDTLPWPIIVKPHDDGCSVMVQKTRTEQELIDALHELFTHEKEHALVEECIEGMELTVGCIGNDVPQALPPSQALSAADILSIEEKFLPGAGENQTPAPLPAKTLRSIQQTVEQIYAALSCKGYTRIDCFYQDETQSPTGSERVVFIEANTLPGLTPATCLFHQAAEIGLKPMDFIDKIIELGMQEHAHAKRDKQTKPIHTAT